MAITKKVSSRGNVKQKTGADFPINPAQIVTAAYGPVSSTAGQLVVNLTFSVDQANKINFFLTVDGKELSEGASNDYTFTSIQANNTSSQITLNQALVVNLNIKAKYLGVVVPLASTTSILSMQAQLDSATVASRKNVVINGNFDFWQRVAGNTTTINTSSTTAAYASDRIRVSSGGGSTHNYSVVRSTDVPTFAQSGFNSIYSSLYTQNTGLSPVAADWRFPFNYRMEGYDYQQIHGKTITLSFWFKASVAGTYSVGFTNAAQNRSLVTTFVVNSANTWEFKSVTVGLDTTGTWNFDNSLGLDIIIGSQSGSNYQTATLNSWITGGVVQSTTSTNWATTSGATIRIAQLSLVEGTTGLGITGFKRCGDTVQSELAMCQRYYEKSYDLDTAPGSAVTAGLTYWDSGSVATAWHSPNFKTTKRAAPGSFGTYERTTGTANQIRNETTPTSVNVTCDSPGQNGFRFFYSNTANVTWSVHWFADAEF